MNNLQQNHHCIGVKPGWRPRFSLQTLGFGLAMLAFLLAANVSTGPPELIVQSIYGRHYGWPMTYLRVPAGEYSHIPPDLFLPGLLVNLTAGLVLAVAVIVVWNRIRNAREAHFNK